MTLLSSTGYAVVFLSSLPTVLDFTLSSDGDRRRKITHPHFLVRTYLQILEREDPLSSSRWFVNGSVSFRAGK